MSAFLWLIDVDILSYCLHSRCGLFSFSMIDAHMDFTFVCLSTRMWAHCNMVASLQWMLRNNIGRCEWCHSHFIASDKRQQLKAA